MDLFLAPEWAEYGGEGLVIAEREVHLWLIRPSSTFVRYLNSAELLRYRSIMNEEVRASYGSAQGGLRRIAAMYMRSSPEQVEMHRRVRGKPYVPGAPEFNLSHTSGRMIVAFSASPVGIDVEAAGRGVNAGEVAKKFFSAEERERMRELDGPVRNLTFLRYWVCKEAIVKLSGDGIYYGLRHARVDLATDGRSQGEYKGREVCLREFRPAADLVAALASWDPLEARVFFRM
jgi:phosphopantetheine--protein transferase-like protein